MVLDDFAGRLFENMGFVMFAVLARFLSEHETMYWGTACSGTESPHWVFLCLAAMDDVNVTFRRVYSAEWAAAKRAWIFA